MATRDEDFVARLFVASTHQPVLFFSSAGQVYKEKVWRLPLAAPQSRGKALVNLLPLEADERITTIMAAAGGRGELGGARRDVRHHARHGPAQQAQRLRAGQPRRQDRHAARRGRAHRRRPDLLRQGRRAADHGARASASAFRSTTCACSRAAIRWACAASRSPRATASSRSRSSNRSTRAPAERAAYLKQRRAAAEGEADEDGRTRRRRARTAPKPNGAALEPERFEAMRAAEQVILTISENGYGKRTSSFEYRVTGRGGKGIVAMAVNARNGSLVASFPVEDERRDHAGDRRRPAHPRARSPASASPAARRRA